MAVTPEAIFDQHEVHVVGIGQGPRINRLGMIARPGLPQWPSGPSMWDAELQALILADFP